MNHSARIARLLVVGAALAFPAFLLLGALRLVLSHEFLRYEYTRPGFPADPYGLTREDRLALGFYAIDYLLNGETIEFLSSLTLTADQCLGGHKNEDTCPMFSKAALGHMEDVKYITNLTFAFGLGLAIAACATVIFVRRSATYRRAILRGLHLGSVLTLAVLASLAVVAAATWNRAFDAFHELFFAAGTWRFPFSDTLIRLYPERLFVDAAIAIIVLVATPCLLVLLLYARTSNKLQ
ncbi:MAG: TIGR01906 family membrane protein [Chloroflexi bacterium]|nr:TIGR01906 family membrane protein [Chloroflexota bacterium]